MLIINVFMQIIILFIIIVVGYFIRFKGKIDKEFTSKLSSLILTVFLPAMIINSMQIDYDNNILNKVIIIMITSFILYGFCFIISYSLKYVFKSHESLGVYQYAIMFSNVGFMGYPVIKSVLGSKAIFFTAIFNLPFNLLIMTIGVYFLCKDNKDFKFSLKLFINPIIISVLFGFFLFIFKLRLPSFINDTLKLLGDLTTPLSMLVIGSMLFESSGKEFFTNKKIYFISFIRLLIIPLCIYFILRLKIRDNFLVCIPVIISAMPVATNTAIMANEYKSNASLASELVFVTTLFSIITIPIISSLIVK